MRDPNPRHFNKLVTLESLTDTKDTTTGEFTQTATAYCQRYASIEPLTGREMLQAHAVESDITHKVTMQWDSKLATVTPKMRIKYVNQLATRYFNILAVKNIEERNRILEFVCKEQT